MTSEQTRETDAIRYAVLYRLAPGIRHGLMGELQAIQFMAELAARQRDERGHNSRTMDGLQQMVAQTRGTVAHCRSLIEWLRPDAGSTTALGEGIAQCLKVVGDDWPLRGVEATTELGAPDTLVDKSALREILAASLMALIDMNPGTLDIDIQSDAHADEVELRLRARAVDRRATIRSGADEHKFTWADVQLLAKAHGVSCSCQASGATVRLRRIAPPETHM
ncbi:MAG: hypothetical protein E6H53_10065 [Betaproteobacteria bacterium]|nr:MAG: hypothetical protein E6H53_10065 [Betaproteobacteria bacterium]